MVTNSSQIVLISKNCEEVLSLNIINESYDSISKQADATIKIMWHGLLLGNDILVYTNNPVKY